MPSVSPRPSPSPVTDTYAPRVALYGSTSGRGSIGTRVTLRAYAYDNVAVTKAQFFVDGQSICVDSVARFECEWQLPSNPKSSYRFDAKALDEAGNVGVSRPLMLYLRTRR